MSWWISLQNEDCENVVTDKSRVEGATMTVGGTTDAELNVTYNYGRHFQFALLDQMTAEDASPVLDAAIDRLGDKTDPDYWKPTEGNVKHAIKTLREFAKFAIDNNIKSKFDVN